MRNQADLPTDRRPADFDARRGWPDLLVVSLAGVLVLASAVAGALLARAGDSIHAPAAPLFARFHPHVGPGTPLALLVAGLVVAFGPRAALTWRWRPALAAAGAAAAAWTVSLALVRGRAGILGPLASRYEYLIDVPRARALTVPQLLNQFAASIPADSPDPWHTHTAGHPPGMFLVFVLLSRAGLPGPGSAAVFCLLAAGLIVPGVALTARMTCGELWARRSLPYLVLLPAVIWTGVSADAVIAATGVLGLLLLARATAESAGSTGLSGSIGSTGSIGWAAASGAVLGLACFLSYGAVLLGLPAVALLWTRGRRRLVLPVAVGGLVVVALFAVGGFAWWDGYAAVRGRYLAGYGGSRPYGYWSWADLAAAAIAVGPAVVAGLARLGSPRTLAPPAARALAGGALSAVLLAAVTGMSKGEVERIWLPWTVWLPLAAATLPWSRVRYWLVVQVVVALLVEHLFITPW